MPKILFISDANVFEPINGGSICVDRHVTRLLADGWEVDWVIPQKLAEIARFHHPNARIFHPPELTWRLLSRVYSISHSARLAHLRAKFCIMLMAWRLNRHRYDTLLTRLNGDFTLVASEASRQLRLPLSVIVYDEREVWASSQDLKKSLYRQTRSLFDQATRVWFITPEIRCRYASMGCPVKEEKVRSLLPIPGVYPLQERRHRPGDSSNPTYVYAGDFHKGQDAIIRLVASILPAHDGTFMLICPTRRLSFFADDIRRGLPIVPTKQLSTPEEAFHFIADRASVLLVCYAPTDVQPMARGSFPSKILEYAFLGLPILIIAPKEAAVYRWAKNRQWPCLVESGDESGFEQTIAALSTEVSWSNAARASRQLAITECDPSRIHAHFVEQIPLN